MEIRAGQRLLCPDALLMSCKPKCYRRLKVSVRSDCDWTMDVPGSIGVTKRGMYSEN